MKYLIILLFSFTCFAAAEEIERPAGTLATISDEGLDQDSDAVSIETGDSEAEDNAGAIPPAFRRLHVVLQDRAARGYYGRSAPTASASEESEATVSDEDIE